MSLPVIVVGLSHKTAPVDVRERFAADKEILPEILASLARRPELEEAMFLSTCNRVEVIALSKRGKPAEQATLLASGAIREVLRDHIGASSVEELSEWLYEISGDAAVRHVFRVASSLDSMVLGEPQILGQVKSAYDAAVASGALRSHLSRCLSHAFTVAKRIRTETQLGAGTVSISSVAVDLARRIFGDLSESTVLLVGAGEMAEAAAKSLGRGARAVRVCNRSFDRAAHLASTFGGTAAPLDQLETELVMSDVVVASTASVHYVVTRDLVRRVMKQRKGRTLFFIDIAVPRNVEPLVHELDNVYVFNVDDLEQEVLENMKARRQEVAAAEAIIDSEMREWSAWARGLDVAPTVIALRARTRGMLMTELERTLSGRLKHLGDADRAALLQMMESATNKLLHAPTTRLKAAAQSSESNDLVEALVDLFDLPAVLEGEDEPEIASEKRPARERTSVIVSRS
ncbi:MAG: glutamyl-tRNA reductase [Polyangiaceae bacterium]|nr:glutamyl-tRNA reductase [Polyangiaceae bacterium]